MSVTKKSPSGSTADVLAAGASMGGWSANGNGIAYTKWLSHTANQVWTMKADGTDKQQITGSGNPGAPEYTPDGDILYTKFLDDGTARLFTRDASGNNLQEIAPDVPGDMVSGTFAPGGGPIAFQYVSNSEHGIYTVHLDGTGLFTVTAASSTSRLTSRPAATASRSAATRPTDPA